MVSAENESFSLFSRSFESPFLHLPVEEEKILIKIQNQLEKIKRDIPTGTPALRRRLSEPERGIAKKYNMIEIETKENLRPMQRMLIDMINNRCEEIKKDSSKFLHSILKNNTDKIKEPDNYIKMYINWYFNASKELFADMDSKEEKKIKEQFINFKMEDLFYPMDKITILIEIQTTIENTSGAIFDYYSSAIKGYISDEALFRQYESIFRSMFLKYPYPLNYKV
jgi:hypothetical protein